MTRFSRGRLVQLLAALFLLAGIGTWYNAAWRYLPPRLRSTVQLDDVPDRLYCSPDSSLLVTYQCRGSLDVDGNADIWDVETGIRLSSLSVPPMRDVDIRVSPNGKVLAVAGDGRITFWKPSTGQLSSQVDLPGFRGTTRFSRDSRILLCGRRGQADESDQITVFDTETQKELMRIAGDDSTLRFAPDGMRFVVCHPVADSERVKVCLWDLSEDGKPRAASPNISWRRTRWRNVGPS
jgi:WD40 repeat protein